METDLKKIRRLSKEKNDENWNFRAFLKGYDIPVEELDAIVHELYEEVSSKIDCTACANCCKEMRITLDEEDIEKLSKSTGLPVAKFKGQYLKKDNEGERLVFKEKTCPF